MRPFLVHITVVLLSLVSLHRAYAAPRQNQLPPGPVAASMRDGLPVQKGGGSAADTEWIDLLTAVELAQQLPMLSELRKIYDKTEMGFKLEQSRHITIFMPNNDALKASKLDLLSMSYVDSLQILNLHIIPELVKASELPEGSYEYETMAGINVTIDINRSAKKTRGNRQVSPLQVTVSPVDSNIKANVLDPYGVDNANGVSYITTTLLVPAAVAEKYATAGGADRDFELPDYIETTNQFHWQYGRVGGIPEVDTPPMDTATTQPARAAANEALRGSRHEAEPEVVVGVLRPSGSTQNRLRSSNRDSRETESVEEGDGERTVRRARRRGRDQQNDEPNRRA